MGLVQRTINQCDVCGYEWIPRSDGVRCGNRKCRSTRWNMSGGSLGSNRKVAAQVQLLPPDTKPDMAALRAIAAGKTTEAPDPEVEMCAYKEYDQDTGETMGCGLPKHSMKQRHGAWRRLST